MKKSKSAPPPAKTYSYAEDQIVTVWITQYALTEGLFQLDVRMCHGRDSEAKPYAKRGALFTRGWVETYEEAVAVAEAMRVAHLRSLARQIEKLMKATFKAVPARKSYAAVRL